MKENQSTIIAVGAHHDDNELIAGTLAKHKQAGWRVVSVVMTNGKWAANEVSDDNITIRDAESQAAAELLGMELVLMKQKEGNLQPSPELTRTLVRVLRAYKPDVLITHPPRDYHLDHMSTSRAVLNAVLRCGNPCFDCDLPSCPQPRFYYSDAWFIPFEPDEYVDISDFIALKLDMLRCHKSQIPEDDGTETMIELASLQSRTRGIESGVKYAEAFRFVPQLGRVRMSGLLS